MGEGWVAVLMVSGFLVATVLHSEPARFPGCQGVVLFARLLEKATLLARLSFALLDGMWRALVLGLNAGSEEINMLIDTG